MALIFTYKLIPWNINSHLASSFMMNKVWDVLYKPITGLLESKESNIITWSSVYIVVERNTAAMKDGSQ